ncbi:hypothetical protein AB0D66_26935 [Streptomyces sp. NPDC048270]
MADTDSVQPEEDEISQPATSAQSVEEYTPTQDIGKYAPAADDSY